MTEADLVKLLSERFYGNFADETARRVRDAGAVDLLYGVATAPHPELPKPVRQKVLFRSAYVLERIWFGVPEAFMPHAEERIAEAAAEWAVSPESKVAVKVWAVEVLKRCRERVGWVAESWDDIVEAMALDATPGIESRMRKSWKARP